MDNLTVRNENILVKLMSSQIADLFLKVMNRKNTVLALFP